MSQHTPNPQSNTKPAVEFFTYKPGTPTQTAFKYWLTNLPYFDEVSPIWVDKKGNQCFSFNGRGNRVAICVTRNNTANAAREMATKELAWRASQNRA